MIHGFTDKHNFTGKFSVCNFQVFVPEGLYIKAYSQILGKNNRRCIGNTFMTAGETITFQPVHGNWSCDDKFHDESKSPLLLMPGNVMFIKIQDTSVPSDFWLYFEATRTNLRESLHVVYESETTGYITHHGFDENLSHAWGQDVFYILHLPRNHRLMLSSQVLEINIPLSPSCTKIYVELHTPKGDGQWGRAWRRCGSSPIGARTYGTQVAFKFTAGFVPVKFSFKFLFSFHPFLKWPYRCPSGLYDCTRHFDSFRQHLDCNLRVECHNREDEAEHCPFSSVHCKDSIYLQVRAGTVVVVSEEHSYHRKFY